MPTSCSIQVRNNGKQLALQNKKLNENSLERFHLSQLYEGNLIRLNRDERKTIRDCNTHIPDVISDNVWIGTHIERLKTQKIVYWIWKNSTHFHRSVGLREWRYVFSLLLLHLPESCLSCPVSPPPKSKLHWIKPAEISFLLHELFQFF